MYVYWVPEKRNYHFESELNRERRAYDPNFHCESGKYNNHENINYTKRDVRSSLSHSPHLRPCHCRDEAYIDYLRIYCLRGRAKTDYDYSHCLGLKNQSSDLATMSLNDIKCRFHGVRRS